ncbi:FxLD family lanthipeptide [Streptomyces sp. NPDC058469]|uniref:FxLD family lanthipeptide n=1 Tax=Streptomyces sp. NPDC058469 TaxID=3346514 RepID=UPI0036652358
MSIQMERPVAPAQSTGVLEAPVDDFELDVAIVEGGPAADQLIRMTNDGCNSTCGTACTSCP